MERIRFHVARHAMVVDRCMPLRTTEGSTTSTSANLAKHKNLMKTSPVTKRKTRHLGKGEATRIFQPSAFF